MYLLPKCSVSESAPESSSSSGLRAYPGKIKGSFPLWYLKGDLKSLEGGAAEKSLKSRLLGDCTLLLRESGCWCGCLGRYWCLWWWGWDPGGTWPPGEGLLYLRKKKRPFWKKQKLLLAIVNVVGGGYDGLILPLVRKLGQILWAGFIFRKNANSKSKRCIQSTWQQGSLWEVTVWFKNVANYYLGNTFCFLRAPFKLMTYFRNPIM